MGEGLRAEDGKMGRAEKDERRMRNRIQEPGVSSQKRIQDNSMSLAEWRTGARIQNNLASRLLLPL